MRTMLLASLAVSAVTLSAQAPAPATPPRPAQPAAPAPAAPAQAAPAPRRPQAAPARAGIAMTVTNARGVTLKGIRVEVLGVSDRAGETNSSGQVNFVGMQAGTYRVRFSGEEVIAFERELTLRNGQTTSVDITLNDAPEPVEVAAPPPPSPEPAAPVVGPVGQPQIVPVVDLIERELINNSEPRRETLVSCSGNTRTTLVQLNENQPDRRYDTAEIAYYVVAGEGAVRISARDMALGASSYVSVPRGTTHSLARRGRRPLILLATLSGAPCEEAR